MPMSKSLLHERLVHDGPLRQQEELEEQLEVLENAEDIKRKLSQVLHLLDESEVAMGLWSFFTRSFCHDDPCIQMGQHAYRQVSFRPG